MKNKNTQDTHTSKDDKKESQVHVEETCGKCDEHLAGWKRALADYDNLKKDLVREQGQMRQTAKEDTVQLLLPVLDNFDQAVKFVPDEIDKELKGWLNGILHVRDQLEEVLKELGAEAFGQAGDKFDPDAHDAVGEDQKDGQDDQIVLEVTQRGWKMSDRIIRPAKVVVNNHNT